MPLVFLARWMGHPNTRRVYGPDLMLAACERSQETQWRRYYFYEVALPGISELLAERLQQRFPRMGP